jgi:hypothetical protein
MSGIGSRSHNETVALSASEIDINVKELYVFICAGQFLFSPNVGTEAMSRKEDDVVNHREEMRLCRRKYRRV